MMQHSLVLADAILAAHSLFVAFVVLAVPVILIGAWRGWTWVRNPWFRIGHLAAIGFVVINTWLGEACPLTLWENGLRLAADPTDRRGDFIAYWLGRLLFWDFPGWVFTLAYSLFGAAVVTLLWIAPIRLRCRQPKP